MCVMSIDVFGSRSLSVKIGEFYHDILTKAMTFAVLILRLDIIILIFS